MSDEKFLEFADTEESRMFLHRQPRVVPFIEQLILLSNKFFSQRPPPKSRLEHVCFGLGFTCREDFAEIVFMATNGYGNGSVKLLRGFYERAVTIAFLLKHPDKVERFMRYGAIQEHRSLEAALKVISPEEWDKHSPDSTVAQMKDLYKLVTPEFQVTKCGQCKTTRLGSSWDEKDIASMVHELGEPYAAYYLGAYSLTNMSIHATFSSAMRYDDEPSVRLEKERHAGDTSLHIAMGLLVTVMGLQNELFELHLDDDLMAVGQAIDDAWD